MNDCYFCRTVVSTHCQLCGHFFSASFFRALLDSNSFLAEEGNKKVQLCSDKSMKFDQSGISAHVISLFRQFLIDLCIIH